MQIDCNFIYVIDVIDFNILIDQIINSNSVIICINIKLRAMQNLKDDRKSFFSYWTVKSIKNNFINFALKMVKKVFFCCHIAHLSVIFLSFFLFFSKSPKNLLQDVGSRFINALRAT